MSQNCIAENCEFFASPEKNGYCSVCYKKSTGEPIPEILLPKPKFVKPDKPREKINLTREDVSSCESLYELMKLIAEKHSEQPLGELDNYTIPLFATKMKCQSQKGVDEYQSCFKTPESKITVFVVDVQCSLRDTGVLDGAITFHWSDRKNGSWCRHKSGWSEKNGEIEYEFYC